MNRPTLLVLAVILAGCTQPLRMSSAYRGQDYDSTRRPSPYPLDNDVEEVAPALENLTLEAARNIAVRRNHGVAAAAAAVEEARARIGEARAAFLPTMSGRLFRTANRETTVVQIPGGGSFPLSPEYITRGQAELSLSLFAFGRDKANLDAARAELDAEFLNERSVVQALLFEVTTSWYRVHNAISQLQVANDSEAASKRQLDDSENIYVAGRYSKDQVLIAKVNWLRSKQETLVAENALVHARRILNVLLARPVLAVLSVGPPGEFHEVKLDPDQLVAWAKEHNPALVVFRVTREALEKRREAVALSWAPEVTGALAAEHTNFRQASGFSTNYTATLGIQITPINGGLRIAQLQQLHAQLARLSEDEKQALRNLDLDIRRTILDIQESESQVELARSAIESATESYRIISDRFRNGKTTSRDVLEAQVTLSDSRNSYNLGRFGHRVLLARMESLVGVPMSDWLLELP